MILTCSSCSTRYLIDPASIGDDGRTVKCAKCGHKWREYPPVDKPKQVIEEVAENEEIQVEEEPPAEAMSIREMVAAAPKPRSQPRKEPKKKKSWLGWLVFILLLGGTVAGAYYGRDFVVQVLPASAKLYQKLKIDVKTANQIGLEIREIKTRSVRENGVVRMTVTLKIENVTGVERPIPRVGIQLKNDKGHPVYSWSAASDQKSLEPWGSIEITSSINEPPKEAKYAGANWIGVNAQGEEKTQ